MLWCAVLCCHTVPANNELDCTIGAFQAPKGRRCFGRSTSNYLKPVCVCVQQHGANTARWVCCSCCVCVLHINCVLGPCRYIEACESGSMFEGLLGNDLDIYVTTAANAIESSWATYCPTFDSYATQTDSTAAAAAAAIDGMSKGGSAAAAVSSRVADGSWRAVLVKGLWWLQQQLGRVTGAPQQQGGEGPPVPPPTPQFTTCLGDLYSVAWLEDAEGSNLTDETLLQQYKKVKVCLVLGGSCMSTVQSVKHSYSQACIQSSMH